MKRSPDRSSESSISPVEIRAYYESRDTPPWEAGGTGWRWFKGLRDGHILRVNADTGEWEQYAANTDRDVIKAGLCSPDECGDILDFEMRHSPGFDRFHCLLRVREIVPSFPHYHCPKGSDGWFQTPDVVVKKLGLGPMVGWTYVTIAANTVRHPRARLYGKCIMAQDELAAQAGISVRALRNALRVLEAAHLLLITYGQSKNTYELIDPRPNPFQSAPRAESNDDSSRHHVPSEKSQSASGAGGSAPRAECSRHHVPSEEPHIKGTETLGIDVQRETKSYPPSEHPDVGASALSGEVQLHSNGNGNGNGTHREGSVEMVTVNCGWCGVEFSVMPGAFKHRKAKSSNGLLYHNRACYQAARKTEREMEAV